MLWGSMRHIVSPSVADGAFHYYEKISFQLFFVTQEKVKHIKQLPVDVNAIKGSLSSLTVPSQKPMFSQHMLPLSEDPALANGLCSCTTSSCCTFTAYQWNLPKDSSNIS